MNEKQFIKDNKLIDEICESKSNEDLDNIPFDKITTDKSEKDAQKILDNMSVEITGARPGDILLGIAKTSNKAKIKIHKHEVYPRMRTLDILRSYPQIWTLFIDKLNSIPFFAEMSSLDKEIYLAKNEVNIEDAIGENKERIEYLFFGNSDFTKKLSDDDLTTLLSNHNSTAYELYDIWPKKPGSRARRPTLILYKYAWKINSDYQMLKMDKISEFKGIILENDSISSGSMLYIIENMKNVKGGKSIGILSDNSNIIVKYPSDEPELSSILKLISAGGLKSLLQKIIRFQPVNIEINPGKVLISEKVLKYVIIELLNNPGSFVADINRYVFGIESLCKRLGIISGEDSYINKDDEDTLFSLFLSALLSQRVKAWKPGKDLIVKWIKFGIKMLNTDKAIKYDINNTHKPVIIDNTLDKFKLSSAILDELKSFSGDLSLIRDIAYTQKFKSMKPPKNYQEILILLGKLLKRILMNIGIIIVYQEINSYSI